MIRGNSICTKASTQCLKFFDRNTWVAESAIGIAKCAVDLAVRAMDFDSAALGVLLVRHSANWPRCRIIPTYSVWVVNLTNFRRHENHGLLSLVLNRCELASLQSGTDCPRHPSLFRKKGLFRAASAREGASKYKSYSEATIHRLEFIRDAQAAGLSIGDLTIFLSQINAQDGEYFDGDAFITAKIEEIEARIAASQRFLDTLRVTQASLAAVPKAGAPRRKSRNA